MRCETITGSPSPHQPGWTLWGDSGYALESSLRPREVWYELASAGLCDIKGMPDKGRPVAQPGPTPALAPEAAIAVVPAHHGEQTIHQDQGLPLGVILAVALTAVVGIAYWRDKMAAKKSE